jgi:hypothetical protein
MRLESSQSFDDGDRAVLCDVRVFVPHDVARYRGYFETHDTE